MPYNQILEEAAKPAPGRDATTQKIGDYYAACMDEKFLDARGLAPLQPELDRIKGLTNKFELSEEVARLHTLANAMKDDLGLTGKGPGVRPLGRAANPRPLINLDGTIRPEFAPQ